MHLKDRCVACELPCFYFSHRLLQVTPIVELQLCQGTELGADDTAPTIAQTGLRRLFKGVK